MRHAAYLSTSRHGIFYFRWPIPAALHPAGHRTDIKLSLGTHVPGIAKQLSLMLVWAGQSVLAKASTDSMRYDEIRTHVQAHFRNLLKDFKGGVSETGPLDEWRRGTLTASRDMVRDDAEGFLALGYPDGVDGLLGGFCAAAGIKETLTSPERKLLTQEIIRAFGTYMEAAVDHDKSFDTIDISEPTEPTVAPLVHAGTSATDAEPYAEIVRQYLTEGKRANTWAAKTLGEKEDALALLSEITAGKSVDKMTKADARKVKDVLMRLPRNRRKIAITRDLTLEEMLMVKGVDVITARTVNAYISNLQSFFKWAVDNGHAAVNLFEGMRIRVTIKAKEDDRKAFTAYQLKLLFTHLTTNPDGLVKKDDHKWPALIGMFSGMRLNEIAQLQPDDVRLVDEVWCFDVNTTGGINKSLKNQSSHRLVPVHDRLLELNLLAFVEGLRSQKAPRLFPSLTYSKQNGYGRNAGRWFNDSFLPTLGIAKGAGLMFHCLRHTMITQLAQREAPETHLKALVGHIQVGVTYTSYFKAGFLPSQLQRAVNMFDI